MTKRKCILCKKPAKYKEESPDGNTLYFCSVNHNEINRKYWNAKGIVWRGLKLEKLK